MMKKLDWSRAFRRTKRRSAKLKIIIGLENFIKRSNQNTEAKKLLQKINDM